MNRVVCVLMAILLCFMCGCAKRTNDGTNEEVVYVDEQIIEKNESVLSESKDITSGEESDEKGEQSKPEREERPIVSAPPESEPEEPQETPKPPVHEIKPADINTVGEKPLYYSHLTDSQKQIYRYTKTAVEQMQAGFFTIGAAPNGVDRHTDIVIALRALSADNPQYFWLPDTYIVSHDGGSMAFSYLGDNVSYPVSGQEKTKMEIRLTTTVNNLVAQANTLSSRYEKELFFHDWLCENVVYSELGDYTLYTAYGALVNGAAVCEGYSRAMQLLCDAAGIPCTVVYGSSRDVGHMWNVINPGDGWYHLDVTWDDDETFGVTRHGYFNLTDNEIAKDHELFELVVDGKEYAGSDSFNMHFYNCTNTKYNYFIKNNLFFVEDYAANAKIIADAHKAGKSSIEVGYYGREYDNFLSQVNNALYQSGSDAWIQKYAYLGDSLVLWW